MFHLQKVSAGYNGTTVLHEISLRIEKGERVALLGPSGSGKSTLLGLLYAQQRMDAAFIPQHTALVYPLSVFHNTYIGRLHQHATWYNLLNLVHPLPGEVAAIRPILERLGLVDKLHISAGELSGGQQQRTGVARALFHGGVALLGDEPISAVDNHQSREVLEAIDGAFDTVVLALHDVEMALRFTDRLIGLNAGRIVFDRPSAGMRISDLDAFYANGNDANQPGY